MRNANAEMSTLKDGGLVQATVAIRALLAFLLFHEETLKAAVAGALHAQSTEQQEQLDHLHSSTQAVTQEAEQPFLPLRLVLSACGGAGAGL